MGDSTGGIPSLIAERFVVKTEVIVVVSVVVEVVLNVALVSVVSNIFSASKFSSISRSDFSANFLIKSAIFAAIVSLAPSLITLLKESKASATSVAIKFAGRLMKFIMSERPLGSLKELGAPSEEEIRK